jgi:hypothetical protein
MSNSSSTSATGAAIAVLVFVAACSDGAATSSPSSTSVPSASTTETTFEALGDEFYEPPDPMPEGSPGTLIRDEEFEAPDGARAWRVLYHSQAIDGRDIAVSGEVYVPQGDAPPGGRPVVAVGPGATGLADHCSSSKVGAGPPDEVLEPLLDSGYIVAVTDYEGLGTPGVHPLGVGESAGRGILDIARAALVMPDSEARPEVVLYGETTGGHGAYFAADIAPDYAPELQVLGTVTQAPMFSPEKVMRGAAVSAGTTGYLMMFIVGFNAGYPDRALLEEVLTPEGMAEVDAVNRHCFRAIIRHLFARSSAKLLTANPADVPSWLEVLEANALVPGRFDGPMLLTKGGADPFFPQSLTDASAEELCAAGASLDYRVYPGATDTALIGASADDVVDWVRDRVEGRPLQSTC